MECAITDLFNRSAKTCSCPLCPETCSVSAGLTLIGYVCASGYPFSTYGDTAACWLQDIILVLLITKYR